MPALGSWCIQLLVMPEHAWTGEQFSAFAEYFNVVRGDIFGTFSRRTRAELEQIIRGKTQD